MALKIVSAREGRQHRYENWPDKWPRKENSDIWWDNVTQEQCDEFEELIKRKSGERDRKIPKK